MFGNKESNPMCLLINTDVAVILFSSLLFQQALQLLKSGKSIPCNSSVSLNFSGITFTLKEFVLGWEKLQSMALNFVHFFVLFLYQEAEKILDLPDGI